MTELVAFSVPGADPVLAEVDGPQWTERVTTGGIGPVGRPRDGGREIPIPFESHLQSVRAAAVAALDAFRASLTPDEIKLTFGVKLTAEAGAIIAKTVLEGNLGVELVWKRPPAADVPPA
jgi:hypothetical protein